MTDPHDEGVFLTLADFLADRQRKRMTLCDDLNMRGDKPVLNIVLFADCMILSSVLDQRCLLQFSFDLRPTPRRLHVFAEEQFRQRLLEMSEENSELKARVAELESKLAGQQQLQRRVRSLEKYNDDLQRTANNMVANKQALEHEVSCVPACGGG